MAKKRTKKSKVIDPKLVKEEYTLIEEVYIDNVLHPKGAKVKLTNDGKNYFKSINKIR